MQKAVEPEPRLFLGCTAMVSKWLHTKATARVKVRAHTCTPPRDYVFALRICDSRRGN